MNVEFGVMLLKVVVEFYDRTGDPRFNLLERTSVEVVAKEVGSHIGG